MKLLVYGTLKKNYGNNTLLQGSKFLGNHIVKGYRLHGKSGIPFARPHEESQLRGELYEVDEEKILPRLDALEGHPRWYVRTVVDKVGDDPVHMYVGPTGSENREVCDIVNGAYEWGRFQ